MTVLFMGGEMSALLPSDSSVIEGSGSALTYNSSFARTSTLTRNASTYCECTPSASATTAWLHFDLYVSSPVSSTTVTRLSWYDSSGNERIRIKWAASTTTLGVDYWNGSAFTSAGTCTVSLGSLQTIDLNVVCNSASGSIVLYIAGTERINSGAISTTSITNLKKFRGLGGTISGVSSESYWSQFIMADEPTIGWRLITRYPNAAGTTSSWGGAYSDLDETAYSDADFNYSATANQVSTFTQTGPSISGYTVRAVAVSARAKKGASGPTQIQLALRSAGTDYFSSTQALSTGYTAVQNIWEANPATTADWLASAIDTLQPGMKSIA